MSGDAIKELYGYQLETERELHEGKDPGPTGCAAPFLEGMDRIQPIDAAGWQATDDRLGG